MLSSVRIFKSREAETLFNQFSLFFENVNVKQVKYLIQINDNQKHRHKMITNIQSFMAIDEVLAACGTDQDIEYEYEDDEDRAHQSEDVDEDSSEEDVVCLN